MPSAVQSKPPPVGAAALGVACEDGVCGSRLTRGMGVAGTFGSTRLARPDGDCWSGLAWTFGWTRVARPDGDCWSGLAWTTVLAAAWVANPPASRTGRAIAQGAIAATAASVTTRPVMRMR